MAKTPNRKAAARARIVRTEAYAEKVRKMFAQTVNDIIALNKTLPALDTGVMFSFDDAARKIREQTEVLLHRLHSATTMAIEQGIKLEWEQANAECDKLIKSCFGKKTLENPKFRGWLSHNTAARQQFISRSEGGLNLSQRVWKSCRQLREEMEVAMTVAIGEGASSQSIGRAVRQYLNDPDLMFRRFRYKDENGNWKRKWKKRIIDPETDKHKWIDYDRDSYRTGSGVYKSSAKNAMRVARTETNIAYRHADQERWAQLDFVRGQRIELSRSHPRMDICDTLAGDYPKDFVFEGWHPQCFCVTTPILVTDEEMVEMADARMRGEEYTPKTPEVKDVPDRFKEWIKDNADNIAAARERGTEPYFLRSNAAAIDHMLGNTPSKEMPQYGAAMKLGRKAAKEAATTVEDIGAPTLTPEQSENIATLAKSFGVPSHQLKPMSFIDADEGASNPTRDTQNCQSCVVAFTARRMGLNCVAISYDKLNDTMRYLGDNFSEAWINPKTGNTLHPTILRGDSDVAIIDKLRKQLNQPGEYVLGINQKNGNGHVVNIIQKGGKIIVHDEQATRASERYFTLEALVTNMDYVELIRVDKAILNIELVRRILTIP